MPSRRLAELRAPQLADRLDEQSIFVLPLGSIEQHGPHLPFRTDLTIAEEVAAATVEEVGEEVDAWLLPALAYTKSNEHAWSAGTFWLGATTLLAVLDDIGRSVATTPVRKLVFLNGHGGNSALVAMANRELRLAHGLMTFLAHPFLPPDQGGGTDREELGEEYEGELGNELGMGIHAGLDETSMMLYLAPDTVDMSVATRNVPEDLTAFRHVRFGGSVPFGWLSDDFGPDGHLGDPTGATAERGRHLFRRAVDGFAETLREVAAFELPR